MSEIERNILTIVEPTIELDELAMPDVESGSANSEGLSMKEKPSKFSSITPMIQINRYEIQTDRLISFKLRNTGFYPTCRIIFDDVDSFFLSRNFPKDGDLIQLNIRSQGDETTFKPIRIDFIITSISPGGGGGGVSANRFIVEGQMNVPNLFTETNEVYSDTSFNTLLSVAERLGLGYASNVDETSDSMVWINPNDTTEKFIKDTVANSYLDDESFFTAYIDPYYYLTFVDVNKFFGQDGEIEISKEFFQNQPDTAGIEGASGESDDFPNILSNILQLQGKSRYISKHQLINNSGSVTKNNGYKRYSQHWDLPNKNFISEFVDPLITDSETTLPATKGRLLDGEVEGPRNEQIRYKYLGMQSENVHDEYMYSVILNYQNLVEVTKLGMVIELDTANPALLRYSRIYCHILEYDPAVKEVLLSPSDSGLENNPNQQEREVPTETDADENGGGIVNEFLSGYYVISGLEYILTNPGGVRMKLYLQRREFTPST
tara:strand:- start:100280 stop:101755 length:1476 start_codon:yes stop_codon:yes gene_type:complete